jgi:hypothetical protein
MLLIHFSSFDVDDYLAEFGVKAISKQALEKMKKLAEESKGSNPGNLAKKWSTEKRVKVMGSVDDQFILAGAAGKDAADDLAQEYTKKGLGRFVPKRSNQAITSSSDKLKQAPQTLKTENLKYNPDLKTSKLNLDSDGYYYGWPKNRTTSYTKGTTDINDYLDTQYATNHPFAKPMVMTPAEATPYTPAQKRYADGLKNIKNKVDDSDFLVGIGKKQNDFGSNRIGTPQNKQTIKQPTTPQQKEQIINPATTQKKEAIRQAKDEVEEARKKQAQRENDVEGVKTKLKNEDTLEQQKKLTSEEFNKAFKEQMVKNAVVGGAITAGSIGGAVGIKGYLDRKKQRRLQQMNKQYG